MGLKGIFIPDITVEMFRNGCLESIEDLMAEGEIYDIEYDPKSAQPGQRKGEWIPSENEMFVHCSNCGCQWESGLVKTCNMEFCPSCGKYNGGDS